jgi:hypothetical protein
MEAWRSGEESLWHVPRWPRRSRDLAARLTPGSDEGERHTEMSAAAERLSPETGAHFCVPLTLVHAAEGAAPGHSACYDLLSG